MASPMTSLTGLQGRASTRSPCRFVQLPAAPSLRVQRLRARGSTVRVRAGESEAEEALKGALRKGNEIVDNIVEILPESVPKDVAKPGTVLVAVALAWFVFQKVLGTIIFLGIIGGGLYVFYTINSENAEYQDETGQPLDPVAMAKKIMDKYK